MMNLIENFFKSEGIEYFANTKIENCKIIKPYLKPQNLNSVFIFLIPYFVSFEENSNISLYAQSDDYHLYFEYLKIKMKNRMSEIFPNEEFDFYCDHSPIDEVNAAAICGLGIIGKNRLLINEKYKSYVFIGEIFTSLNLPNPKNEKIKACIDCGNCTNKCNYLSGKSANCLSALSQKKILEKEELIELKKHMIAWGCDNCQTNCPMCENPEKTPIKFFYEHRISKLTSEILNSLTQEEFQNKAFSWRGREPILRNLKNLEM